MESYRKATSEKYNPLIVDLSPHSNPLYKIRMHILPDQFIDSFPTRKLNEPLVENTKQFLALDNIHTLCSAKGTNKNYTTISEESYSANCI